MSDPDLGAAVHSQILDLWVRPELARRGLGEDATPERALVYWEDDPTPRVQLGNEVDWVAAVRATRPIAKGEAISRSDFSTLERLRPASVPEDATWIGYARVGTEVFVAFDFRRDRGQAKKLLALSRDYLATAIDARVAGRNGPAVECAFAAAELAVKAQLMVFSVAHPPRHGARRNQFEEWAQLGNAPAAHPTTLGRLYEARRAARYGEDSLPFDDGEVAALIDQTREMIEYALAQVGDRLPEATP